MNPGLVVRLRLLLGRASPARSAEGDDEPSSELRQQVFTPGNYPVRLYPFKANYTVC